MPMYISTLFVCRNACIQSPLADSFVDYLTEWWMDWQLDGWRQRLYDGLIDGTMLFTYAIILQKYTPTHTHTLLQCELLPRILNIRVYTRVRVLSKTTPYTFTVHIYWNLNDPGCFFSRIELLILIFFFRPMDQGTFGFQVYIQSPSTNPTTMGFLFR